MSFLVLPAASVTEIVSFAVTRLPRRNASLIALRAALETLGLMVTVAPLPIGLMAFLVL